MKNFFSQAEKLRGINNHICNQEHVFGRKEDFKRTDPVGVVLHRLEVRFLRVSDIPDPDDGVSSGRVESVQVRIILKNSETHLIIVDVKHFSILTA